MLGRQFGRPSSSIALEGSMAAPLPRGETRGTSIPKLLAGYSNVFGEAKIKQRQLDRLKLFVKQHLRNKRYDDAALYVQRRSNPSPGGPGTRRILVLYGALTDESVTSGAMLTCIERRP